MNQRVLLIVAAFVFTAASGATANAQAAQSTQPAQMATQTAAPAQTTARDSGADSPSSLVPEKKVWTNEELDALDSQAGVSTVGKGSDRTSKHAVPAKNHDLKWYRDQIAKLHAKIPPLDSQIAELQAALNGKPTGDAKESARPYSVRADNWSRELAELQKKRVDTIAQISDLQDQARHDGVAANKLP